MKCKPGASAVVRKVAWPALSVPVPIDVAPSRNVTVPVIVPDEPEATVAVNVTSAPGQDGLCEVARAVDVDAEAIPTAEIA